MTESISRDSRPRVLCVDDDRDVAEVVQAILADSGYAISCLYDVSDESLRRAVGQLEPDCVLLDGVPGTEYGSWDSAAWLDRRARHIPVVMFTAHHLDVKEAEEGSSKRARDAGFFAVIEKPFQIDALLDVVAEAVGKSDQFDTSAAGEATRTEALVDALATRGATNIEPSKRREWATFTDKRGTLFQIYWWQDRGVYHVARFKPDGRMQMLGQFTELSAAIEIALPDGSPTARSGCAHLSPSVVDLLDQVGVLRGGAIQDGACGVEHLEGAGLERLGEVLPIRGGQVPSVHARHLAPKYDKDYPDL